MTAALAAATVAWSGVAVSDRAIAQAVGDGDQPAPRPRRDSLTPMALEHTSEPTRPAATGRGIPALDPVPPVVLVLAGVTSIQLGAALAATLFDDLGAAGTSLLRLAFAAVVLVAVSRPRPREHRAGACAWRRSSGSSWGR